MPTRTTTAKSYLSMCRASGTQLNGEAFLLISKIKRHPSPFYKKLIAKALTKMSGGTNGKGRFSFPMVANTSRGVCILVGPSTKIKIDYSFTDNCGRIVLITLNFDCLRLSLCNIYAPNNLTIYRNSFSLFKNSIAC